MSKRRLGVFTLLVAVVVMAMALPAVAVEGDAGGGGGGGGDEEDVEAGGGHGHEDKEMEDIGTGSETAQEFRPEPYEQPAFFEWIIYPLAALGIVATLVVLGLYLLWQPEFEREAQEKKKR